MTLNHGSHGGFLAWVRWWLVAGMWLVGLVACHVSAVPPTDDASPPADAAPPRVPEPDAGEVPTNPPPTPSHPPRAQVNLSGVITWGDRPHANAVVVVSCLGDDVVGFARTDGVGEFVLWLVGWRGVWDCVLVTRDRVGGGVARRGLVVDSSVGVVRVGWVIGR